MEDFFLEHYFYFAFILLLLWFSSFSYTVAFSLQSKYPVAFMVIILCTVYMLFLKEGRQEVFFSLHIYNVFPREHLSAIILNLLVTNEIKGFLAAEFS